ncbi:MAG: hypothetical protein ACKPKO_47860, partial [Candidatus Fonsibacter sp.]
GVQGARLPDVPLCPDLGKGPELVEVDAAHDTMATCAVEWQYTCRRAADPEDICQFFGDIATQRAL